MAGMRTPAIAILLLLGACGEGGSGTAAGSETNASTSTDALTTTTDTPTSTSGGPTTTGVADGSSTTDDDGSTGEPPEPIDCTRLACYFVRADAEDGGDGSAWDTAWRQLPETPERGAVYFFADGDYDALMLQAPESDDAWITLLKATAFDHGTEVGWDPTLGDGQASFPEVVMVSDRWILDGATRNESDWTDTNAYGFRVTGGVTGHTINFGRASNDASFRYLDVGGPPTGVFDPELPGSGFYFGGFDAVIQRWTISRSHVHDVYLPFQLAGASEVTIEYSWLGPNWSKETVRGQGHASAITIRYNVLKDGCQGTPGDPTAPGCTGQIAMWDSDEPGAFDGSRIHGNVIWTTKDTAHSDACILVGGDGGISAQGVSANDVRIYNNTFVGIAAGRCSLRCPGEHEGDEIVDNLWFGLGDGVATDCEADVCDANEHVVDASPFVDADGGDFHLGAPLPGTALAPPFDLDADGVARGQDGVWDVGAFEFVQ